MTGRSRRHAHGLVGSAAPVAAALLAAVSLTSCADRAAPPATVPAPYLTTRDQVGHELVKTEQFIVPVGTAVRIQGLEFPSAPCTITTAHRRLLNQVFNALEEITENTVNDQDEARVAAFKTMQFEVRGYAAPSGHPERDEADARQCADLAMGVLTDLGTPAWRLKATGVNSSKSGAKTATGRHPRSGIRVDFVRTK